MKEASEMLTVLEASQFLHCSEQQVRKQIKLGTIPANKLGREWRLSKAALVALFSCTKTKP